MKACKTISIVVITLMLAMLLASCGETPTPSPTTPPGPTATATLPPKGTPLSEATATPKPTGTATWTPLPLPSLPPHPPIISHRLPAPGEEQRIDAPIVLTFDQPMDQKSVEAAFRIEPVVDGKLAWARNAMTFQPTGRGFARNASYQVTIGEKAKSLAGLALQEPVVFRFKTVGYLEVTDVQPAPDAIEVDMNADVLVTFNRPVVPLTSIGAQANLPQPLQFTPPVTGKGEWLNTSIYTFRPTGGFLPATTYQVRVAAGLNDTTGGTLPEDYVWSFTTKLPAVMQTEPFDKARYVAPSTTITVTFNQPMNHASAESSFSLIGPGRTPVSGSFRWQKNSLIFTPDSPLTLGASYAGKVAAGALAAIGEKGTTSAYTWSFMVIPAPRIISTEPANGEKRADPYTSLQVTFNGPMDRETLFPNLTIIPEPTSVYSYWEQADTQLWLSFGVKPSSSYKITFGPGLAGRYGHPLGQSYTVSFSTRALDPQLDLGMLDRIGTYNAYTETILYVDYVNVSRLDLALYRLSRDDFIKLNSGNWWQVWEKYQPAGGSLLRAWSVAVSAPLNERKSRKVSIGVEEGARLSPGLYYLEVTAPGVKWKARHIMVVSHTHLMLKHGEREALVWATDLATGKPLPNLLVGLYSYPTSSVGVKRSPEASAGPISVQGVTDQDGVFRAALEKHDPWETLFVFASRGEETAIVLSQWSVGLQPWEFNLYSQFFSQPYRGIIYTDRPIYRPGQKVYFKGILRTDDDGRYGLPDLRRVLVAISDDQGKELYKESLALSDLGTFHGELTLGENASLGYYRLNASLEDVEDFSVDASFQVAEYRKPEFLVNVTTDHDAYIQGDTINVHVESSYYFGGPVQDAQVHWRLLSQSYYFQWEGKGWWDFNDYDIEEWQRPQTPYGALITEGKGRTDGEGRFTFRIPADIGERKMSQLFTIEATVTDVNNQEVSERTGVIVHRGLFYIGMQPQTYVGIAGREQKVNIITVDTKSITVTNVALDVVFYEHRWYSVQEKDPDGRLRWTSKSEDIPVFTTTVKTNDVGWAVASFVPKKGGVYRLRAMGKDERGNRISASTYMWVSSEEYTSWRMEDHNRIELVPDKKSYVPGDTAHVLIPSPYQGTTIALLTIERGRILEHRLLTLTSNSEQIAIPVTSEHVPNIYVSVFIVKGQDATNPLASFKLGYASLDVSPQEKELKITLTPDHAVYKPGETAAYAIRATDYGGRGVEAELSLALVDLSVLALSGDQGPDLMEQFYQKRGLGIQTASVLAVSADQYAMEKAAEARGKGGGGGAEEGGLTVRQQFPDTVYWNPGLRTNAQGQAGIQVGLADSLTTWRMRAVAITADTKVGRAYVDIVTTKDLLIRPVTPRFFVIGDKAQLSAIVHNNTDNPIQATVALQATGLEVRNAEQNVTVPAHGLAKVVWETTVLPVEAADLIFSVKGGGLSDAAKPAFGLLPVYHYSTPEVVATSGQVQEGEQRIEVVQLPERLDPSQGDLTLKLEPSLAAGMRDGLTFLKTYPYDCIEQTVSRFLPNVITYRALRSLGIRNAELEAEIPQYVSIGLQRLYALQHYDGGWGWWVSDESHPYLTAYVLFGLNEAQRAGFAVDSDVMARAAFFLENSLDQPLDVKGGPRANARAYVLYVLAEYYTAHGEKGDLGRAVALYERRDILDNYGKAFLAMALDRLAPQERSRLDALLSDLTTSAIRSATGAHWEEKQVDYWTMNTDTRSTAIVLQALVRLAPDNQLIPNVVRWLMVARRQGRWETTQETALAVMALTDYMVVSGELEADYSYRIGLNGQVWGEGSVTKDSVDQPRVLQTEVSKLLRDVGNQIWLEREAKAGQTGRGRLYYSAYLRYFLPVEDVKALNRGLAVTRQYYLLEDRTHTVDRAKVGDVIQVKLTIIAPNDLHYLVVEDPLPAGAEAVDTSLKTTRATYEGPELERVPEEEERLPYWWYFNHSELRDEKVALFATYLPKGTYEYTYLLRASLPGEFLTMPAQAYEMYFPEVFGRSDGLKFVITEE